MERFCERSNRYPWDHSRFVLNVLWTVVSQTNWLLPMPTSPVYRCKSMFPKRQLWLGDRLENWERCIKSSIHHLRASPKSCMLSTGNVVWDWSSERTTSTCHHSLPPSELYSAVIETVNGLQNLGVAQPGKCHWARLSLSECWAYRNK